jgi:hypothetical protein
MDKKLAARGREQCQGQQKPFLWGLNFSLSYKLALKPYSAIFLTLVTPCDPIMHVLEEPVLVGCNSLGSHDWTLCGLQVT